MKAIFYFLFLIPVICHARWPAFTTPDIPFLLTKNYLQQGDCNVGSVKLVGNTIINIQQNFCKTFCSPAWNWFGLDNNNCLDQATLNFRNFDFIRVRGSDGNTSHTVVTANYSDKNSHVLQFLFSSEVGKHWDCIDANPELHTVMCANDI